MPFLVVYTYQRTLYRALPFFLASPTICLTDSFAPLLFPYLFFSLLLAWLTFAFVLTPASAFTARHFRHWRPVLWNFALGARRYFFATGVVLFVLLGLSLECLAVSISVRLWRLVFVIDCCLLTFYGASFFAYTGFCVAEGCSRGPADQYCIQTFFFVNFQRVLLNFNDAKRSICPSNQLVVCRFMCRFLIICFRRKWWLVCNY